MNLVHGTQAIMAAPFGAVLLTDDQGVLAEVTVLPDAGISSVAPFTDLLREAVRQFQGYFEDPRWTFDLPVRSAGTEFQRRVWAALRQIPAGETYTYGRLAAGLGSSARAVAGACRANAYPLIIPCHRVVARQGLGGYCGRLAGPYLDIKRWLLRHEGHGVG